jgi:hypothetical protein
MEEAPENDKELPQSACANGMNEKFIAWNLSGLTKMQLLFIYL